MKNTLDDIGKLKHLIDYSKDEFSTPLLCFDEDYQGSSLISIFKSMVSIGNGTHGVVKVETDNLSHDGIKINNDRRNKCQIVFKRIK